MVSAWQSQPHVCDDEAESPLIHLQRSAVIRTDDTITGFLGSPRLHAELHTDSWTVSGSEGFRRFFIRSPWIKPKSTTGSPLPTSGLGGEAGAFSCANDGSDQHKVQCYRRLVFVVVTVITESIDSISKEPWFVPFLPSHWLCDAKLS